MKVYRGFYRNFIEKSNLKKKIRYFHKILYKPLFGPIETCFWWFRMIENDFPIQMVPLSCKSELGNDDWCQNTVQHKFFLYKPSFGPYGTWFWSSRSIENDFPIQMVPFWCLLELGNDVSWRNTVYDQFFLYKPSFWPYGTWFWPYHSIENWFLILLI